MEAAYFGKGAINESISLCRSHAVVSRMGIGGGEGSLSDTVSAELKRTGFALEFVADGQTVARQQVSYERLDVEDVRVTISESLRPFLNSLGAKDVKVRVVAGTRIVEEMPLSTVVFGGSDNRQEMPIARSHGVGDGFVTSDSTQTFTCPDADSGCWNEYRRLTIDD